MDKPKIKSKLSLWLFSFKKSAELEIGPIAKKKFFRAGVGAFEHNCFSSELDLELFGSTVIA